MSNGFFTTAPSTIATYPLNGQTEFTIPFEFLARKFVVVSLLGATKKVLTLGTDYRFVASNKIQLQNQPDGSFNGIELRRYTSASERLVSFVDGSILRAYDLNIAQVQTLHVAEEARDLAGKSIVENDDGDLDARGRKIVNLLDGSNDGDAVNLGQLRKFDSSTASNADKAALSAAEAKESELNAAASESRAVVAEAKSISSAGTAMTAAADSNRSKTQAVSAKDRCEVILSAVEAASGPSVELVNKVTTLETQRVDVFAYLTDEEKNAVTTGVYGGNVTSVSGAIDRALLACGSGQYPINAKTLWFRNGAWMIDKPISTRIPMIIDGDNARILPSPTFTGLSLTDQATSSSVEVRALMVFVPDGNYNTISGPLTQGMIVTEGIILHCGNTVKHGVYTERFTYASYNMRVDYAETPIVVGPYSWGLSLDNIILENFDQFGVWFKTNSAANGCSIKNPKIWGRFKTPTAGLFFDTDSECNGVDVNGGFIEKVGYGALHAAGSGLCHYNGVDFEQCSSTAIRVVGKDANSIPVTVTACFLDSPVYRVFASGCVVEVSNSILYGKSGGLDFFTESNGKVVAENNQYEGGLYKFNTGGAVVYKDAVSVGNDIVAILPSNASTLTTVGVSSHRNNKASPNLNTSSIIRYHKQISETGSESAIDISASALYNGSIVRTAGIRASTVNGVNAVHPILDNVTALGLPEARMSVVYSASGVIQTSDGNAKTAPKPIDDAVLDAWGEVNYVTFKWLDAIEKKGTSARTHVGVIAQSVKQAFESKGLDGTEYGLLCYDKWEGEPEEVDANGVVLREAVEAGERWGIRPEQCLFLEAAYMRRELQRLKDSLKV